MPQSEELQNAQSQSVQALSTLIAQSLNTLPQNTHSLNRLPQNTQSLNTLPQNTHSLNALPQNTHSLNTLPQHTLNSISQNTVNKLSMSNCTTDAKTQSATNSEVELMHSRHSASSTSIHSLNAQFVAERTRNKEMHREFDTLNANELCLQDFMCANVRSMMLCQGKMFLTQHRILFTSGILNTKIEIPINEVASVVPRRTLGFPNAIRINMLSGESHLFVSFLFRDRAIKAINMLCSPLVDQTQAIAQLDEECCYEECQEACVKESNHTSYIPNKRVAHKITWIPHFDLFEKAMIVSILISLFMLLCSVKGMYDSRQFLEHLKKTITENRNRASFLVN